VLHKQCSCRHDYTKYPTHTLTGMSLLCRLLCVEHVDENDKPCLYLVGVPCDQQQHRASALVSAVLCRMPECSIPFQHALPRLPTYASSCISS
jgi:hypothetical protein